jgi:mono/diheme cytochrome c family protein
VKAVALVLTCLALAGCGGGAAPPVSGAVVFARDCRACHSLIGNESEHKQGGDLLGYHLTRAEWLSFTKVMPAKRPLSKAELNAVVDYVLAAQKRVFP